MKADRIHDALNYLDEDLIEKVDKLRCAKKTDLLFFYTAKERKKLWIRCIASAASFCIIITAMILCNNAGSLQPDNHISKEQNENSGLALKETSPENSEKNAHEDDSSIDSKEPGYCIPSEENMTESIFENENGTIPDDNDMLPHRYPVYPEANDITSDSVTEAEMPSVELRITKWHEDFFTAEVSGILDTDIFPLGTELDVKFSEETTVMLREDELSWYYEPIIPCEEDFPIGSCVEVMFYSVEYSDSGKNTIYIEMIWEKGE